MPGRRGSYVDKFNDTNAVKKIVTDTTNRSAIQMGDFDRPRRRFVLGAWLSALGRIGSGRIGFPVSMYPRRQESHQPL